MRKAVASVQAMPEMEAFFAAQGATALEASPGELERMTREELAKWGAVVKDSGMKID
ncbi:MAG: hypothetical protein JWQ76_4448 [Ramlibacter sp.]|nr:hypothetical protein [Ramlibacter sp.]